ncbi:MAG: hypothetical protein E4G91_00740 [Candidatus Zixiibacteriota bacterium]|nr:MAG: hypothetical protein E4G91_00740 [candidate division Zixibacteria bacterium]
MARKGIGFVLLLLAFAPQLEGVELGLNLYGVCKHLNQHRMSYQPKLNESNPGLGLTINFVHVKYAVVFVEGGFFEDSFKNTATYVSIGYNFPICRYVQLGFHLAIYDSKSINGTVLAPIPIITFRYHALAIHAIYLPKYESINPYHIIGAYLTLYVIDASGRK